MRRGDARFKANQLAASITTQAQIDRAYQVGDFGEVVVEVVGVDGIWDVAVRALIHLEHLDTRCGYTDTRTEASIDG